MSRDESLSASSSPDITRREMLNYTWMTILGVLTLQIFGIGTYFTLPRFRKGEFGGLIELGPMNELPLVNDPPLNHPAGKLWLVHTEKGLSALYKACTHLDCMFSWNERQGEFICPCHGSRFARDGQLLSGPATRPLDRFPIQVVADDGSIIAKTDPNSGAPLQLEMNNPPENKDNMPSEPVTADDLPPQPVVQVDTARKIRGA